MEFKFENMPLPGGQRLALERLCDGIKESIPAYLLIASHSHPPEEDIDAAKAIITEYRHHGEWRRPLDKPTVKEMIDRIREIEKSRRERQTA